MCRWACTHLSDVCGEDGDNTSHKVELVHQRLFHLDVCVCVCGGGGGGGGGIGGEGGLRITSGGIAWHTV